MLTTRPAVAAEKPLPTKRPSGPLTGPLVPLPGSLSLVLPAHNEEANIGIVVAEALAALPRFADRFEVIVVDDGSQDRTGEIVDDLARDYPAVKALHHPANRGYGGALTTGFAATTGDHVMFMDADRQFDIADLALLSPFVADFDVVAGFRMERNDPFIRRVNAEIFNVVVRVLFGVHLRDIDCAFKVFNGPMLRSVGLEAPGALINTEMQAKLRRQGATVQQVGVHHYPRLAGVATGGSWRVIVRAMRETILLFWRMHNYRPVAGEHRRRPRAVASDAVAGVSSVGLKAVSSVTRRVVHRG